MKKRLLTVLLSLVMLLGLFPGTALATGSTTYDSKDAAKNATGVTANKTVIDNEDGTYTITLSVQGTESPTQATTYLPADVAIVVDASTVMGDCTGFYEARVNQYNITNYYCNRCNNRETSSFYKGRMCGEFIDDSDIKVRSDYAEDLASAIVSELFDYTNSTIRVGMATYTSGNYDFPRRSNPNYADETYYKVSLSDEANEDSLIKTIDNIRATILEHPGSQASLTAGLDIGRILLDEAENTVKKKQFVIVLSGHNMGYMDGSSPAEYYPKYSYSDGQSHGKTKANELQNKGIYILAAGILPDSASSISPLGNIISNDKIFKLTSEEDSAIQTLAQTMAKAITDQLETTSFGTSYSGTNAVMTDEINTDVFEYVENSASAGLTVENGKVTWEIDNIGTTEKTVTFRIKPKDSNTSTGLLETNDNVALTFYSSRQSKNVTFTKSAIGEPTVGLYSVTYTDGVSDEEVFADQTTYNLRGGTATPTFGDSNPTREGYTFVGWEPKVADAVTGNATYTAQWTEASTPGGDPTDKISTPGMNKQVVGETPNEIGTVKPGSTVSFTLNSHIGTDLKDAVTESAGAYTGKYDLVFHDTLTGPMTIDYDALTVTVDGKTLTIEQYGLKTDDLTDGCTFEVTVNAVDLLNSGVFQYADAGKVAVVVSYSATVDEDAEDGTAIRNAAYVNNNESVTDTVTGKVDEDKPTPPTTGGSGTALFTAAGVTLMGGAAVLFLVSRRKKERQF